MGKNNFFSKSQQLLCHVNPSGASFTGIGPVFTVQGHHTCKVLPSGLYTTQKGLKSFKPSNGLYPV
jgi:hypothetical protein